MRVNKWHLLWSILKTFSQNGDNSTRYKRMAYLTIFFVLLVNAGWAHVGVQLPQHQLFSAQSSTTYLFKTSKWPTINNSNSGSLAISNWNKSDWRWSILKLTIVSDITHNPTKSILCSRFFWYRIHNYIHNYNRTYNHNHNYNLNYNRIYNCILKWPIIETGTAPKTAVNQNNISSESGTASTTTLPLLTQRYPTTL